jgi:diguanylate cyclase (GGDEF)-like protein
MRYTVLSIPGLARPCSLNIVNRMAPGIIETRVQPPWRPVVADLPSGDRPAKSTNGSGNRQHVNGIPASAPSGHEQTLADSEQTLADSEQTLADTDQSSGERDQTSADCDQVASDRDQAASDRDLAHGADPGEHGASRDIRRRTARNREQTAVARLESANERDRTAQARDLAGLARDRAAAARDLEMAHADAHYYDGPRAVTGAEIVMRAARQRKRAAADRALAAEHREQAGRDREAAAADREQGARDRLQALADREALTHALAITEIDALTGARTRAAGLTDFEHELDRSRRTGGTLVVAYVDVVGLKRVNDSDGHDAGDRLLKRVVALITEHVRSYDLIVRLAGDEFLCAMPDMTISGARERFSAIAGALAAAEEGGLRTGFAELTAGESATELIARADHQLIASRHG